MKSLFRFLQSVRGRLLGLNGIQARFDVLQTKLDALTVSTNSLYLPVKSIVSQLVGRDGIDEWTKPPSENSIGTSESFKDTGIALDEASKEVPGGGDVITTSIHKCDFVYTSLQAREAIRIIFIVQHSSVWPGWRSVWAAANKDPRFIPKVVLTPFIHPFSTEAVSYDDMRQCLINENVPFCTAEFFDVNEYRPHVAFVQNPYEDTRPEHLKIGQLKKAGTRIAYIPYGLEMGGGAWNIAAQFDSPLHKSAWKIFARSERHKKMFGKYCRAGNDHVVVTGHPKLDQLNTSSGGGVPVELMQKIAGRKVILWTPHFSVGNPPTWSTYKRYGEFILTEMHRRQDLFLLIRPHPLFFQAMQQHEVWDAKGEQDFRQSINDSDNLALDENSDYHEAFSVANALMTDVGSFLLEYLPTGKPLLYLHCPDGLGMNDDGDLTRHLYTAFNPADIADFIDMVARGDDPGKAGREAALPEFLFGLDSSAGERICQHIYSSISAGDAWSPASTKQGSTAHTLSETYWKGSCNTYLAPPEYYDSKEMILGEVMARLPKFSKAIDIGCGDGRFTFQLAKHANEITGYDISPSLVEKAKDAAATGNIGNVRFVTQELETIAPFEKYDLVACMGVTSCIIDDAKFLHILDKFSLLSRQDGYLLLIDTLSSDVEQTISEQSGYIAKYRNIRDYLTLIARRGYRLREEVLIKEIVEKKLVNKLFVFEFNEPHSLGLRRHNQPSEDNDSGN